MNPNETETAKKKRRGRPPGSINRRSQLARDIVERLKCDPLEALIRIVKNRRLPIELRLDAAKAATPFVHARLSTTQINAHVRHDASIDARIQALCISDPQIAQALERLALELAAAEPELPVIDVTEERLALPAPSAEAESEESEKEF